MYTVDIHSNKENINEAKYELDIAIKLARKSKDKVISLIVGYGSKSNKHIIKTNILLYLEELKSNKKIKDYISGNELDIFSEKYQHFKHGSLIPDSEKKIKNPGIIYIIL